MPSSLASRLLTTSRLTTTVAMKAGTAPSWCFEVRIAGYTRHRCAAQLAIYEGPVTSIRRQISVSCAPGKVFEALADVERLILVGLKTLREGVAAR